MDQTIFWLDRAKTCRVRASAVLIIEFDFTSAIMLQNEDRVHRLGQASVKKITSTTPFLTVSRVRDFLAGVSHGTATAQRKAGVRAYIKGAVGEAAAKKQMETKAGITSKIERVKKAKREARRKRASSEAGITAGRNQRTRTIRYINEGFAKHERYLKTGQGRLDDDEYRKIVHLMYEYGYDEHRVEKMKDSYTVALAA